MQTKEIYDFVFKDSELPKDTGLKAAAQIYLIKDDVPDYKTFFRVLIEMLSAEKRSGHITGEETRRILSIIFDKPDFAQLMTRTDTMKGIHKKYKKMLDVAGDVLTDREAANFDIDLHLRILKAMKESPESLGQKEYVSILLEWPEFLTSPAAIRYTHSLIDSMRFDKNIYHLSAVLKKIRNLFAERKKP